MFAPHLHQLNSALFARAEFGYVYESAGKKTNWDLG